MSRITGGYHHTTSPGMRQQGLGQASRALQDLGGMSTLWRLVVHALAVRSHSRLG